MKVKTRERINCLVISSRISLASRLVNFFIGVRS
jgi:hypothetical protein